MNSVDGETLWDMELGAAVLHQRSSAQRIVCPGRCGRDLVSDSAENPEQLLPQKLMLFLWYMKEAKFFSGGNTELAEAFNTCTGNNIELKKLKQMMNLWKENLREQGLTFRSYRSNGQRLVAVQYTDQ